MQVLRPSERGRWVLVGLMTLADAGLGCSKSDGPGSPSPTGSTSSAAGFSSRPAGSAPPSASVVKPSAPDALPAGAIRRVGSFRFRHAADVTAVAFSPDGSAMAAGDDSGVLVLWDAASGAEKGRYVLPDSFNHVWSVAYAPAGDRIALGDQRGYVIVLEASSLKVVAENKLHDNTVTSVAFSPSGDWIASAGTRPFAAVWSPGKKTTTPLERREHPDYQDAQFAVWGLDGSFLWVGGEGGGALTRKYQYPVYGMVPPTVKVSFPDAKELGNLSGARRTSDIAMSPKGDRMAVASLNGGVELRDPGSGKRIGGWTIGKPVYSVAFSPSGDRIALTTKGGGARVFETDSGRSVCEAVDVVPEPLDLDFSPDGKRLAIGGGRKISVADASTCAPIGPPDQAMTLRSWALDVSSDGKMIVAADASNRLSIWDAASWVRRQYETAHLKGISEVRLSPNGALLATGGPDGVVQLWRTSDWQKQMSVRVGQQVSAIAFSPDGKLLATGAYTDTAKTEIGLWEVESGRKRRALSVGEDSRTSAISFVDGGATVVALTGNSVSSTLRRWDTAGGELRGSFDAMHASHLAVAPDGPTAIAGSEGKVWVHDANGKLIRELQGPSGWIDALVRSPEGLLAAAGRDGSLHVWQESDGKLLARRAAHAGGCTRLQFGGGSLVTIGEDGTLLIWNPSAF